MALTFDPVLALITRIYIFLYSVISRRCSKAFMLFACYRLSAKNCFRKGQTEMQSYFKPGIDQYSFKTSVSNSGKPELKTSVFNK